MFTGRVLTTIKRIPVLHRILACLVLPFSLGAFDREVLEKRAAAGDDEAQYQLAEALFWGTGGNQDLKQAAVWSRASAKQGNAKGEYRLAVQLILGQGIESNNENDKEGFEWLAKASEGLQKLADQGDHDAQHKLALLYLSGLIKGKEDNPYNIDGEKVVDLVKKAANGGNVSSQSRLGLIHRDGLVGKRSNEKSIEWLRKAADNGSAYAALEIWALFLQSKGELVKIEESRPYLKSAAEAGLAEAQYQYGIALGKSLLGEIDQEAGIEWVKKAAEQGLDSAQLLLGATLATDRILDQDLEKSFVWLSLASKSQSREIQAKVTPALAGVRGQISPAKRLDLRQQVKKFKPKESIVTRNFGLGLQGAGSAITVPMRIDLLRALAHKGNVAAMGILGEFYRKSGKIAKSIDWFELAAEKKNKDASAILARILLTGNNGKMEPDMTGGIKWLRKAAELGDVRSMNGLGEYIIKGEVKGIKPEEAVKWIKKAATNGLAGAQTNLGGIYIDGDLVEQDFAKAKQWFTMAAGQNYARAQSLLGQYYREGHEKGKPNFEEAIKWYRLAARQGEGPAQFALGMMHMDGDGVEQSFKDGYKWLKISQRYGMPGIGKSLARCAKELTPTEIRRADNEVEQFRAQNYYLPDAVAEKNAEPSGKPDIETLQFRANQGDADAQFQLGKRHAAGDGVKLDPVRSYKWFKLAQNSGHDKSEEELEKMIKAQGMKIKQVLAARKLVREFKPKDK